MLLIFFVARQQIYQRISIPYHRITRVLCIRHFHISIACGAAGPLTRSEIMAIFITSALCISLLCFNVQDTTAEKRGDRVGKIGEKLSRVFDEQEDVDYEQFTRSRPEHRSLSPSSSGNLKLAAFNIRIFGRKKMSTPGVPAILVQVNIRTLSGTAFGLIPDEVLRKTFPLYPIEHIYRSRVPVKCA